jgi:hypothetical protein
LRIYTAVSTATVAGLFLIVVPIAFNAAFALLGARFDYPDILRRPTDEVLARFRAGGAGLLSRGPRHRLPVVSPLPRGGGRRAPRV